MEQIKSQNIAKEVKSGFFRRNIGAILAILSAALFIGYIFRHVLFRYGLAPGADVASFAHTAKYVFDWLKEFRHFPSTDNSWYVGFELMYAPPLITYVLGAIYLVVHNIELATRILHPLGLFVLFLGTFWIMKKEKSSTLAAWLGGMVWVFVPVIYGTIESYTKLVALAFLPFLFYSTTKLLESGRPKYMAYIAVLVALSIYGHPMNGIVFSAGLIIYSLIYRFLNQKIPFFRFYLAIIAIILGFLLSSHYLVPFILERAAQPTIARQVVQNSSIFFNMKNLAVLLGGPIILADLIIIFRRRQAKLTAVFLTGLITAVISLGYYYGLDAIFPFDQIYYYVWLFISALCFTYIFGNIVDLVQARGMRFKAVKLAVTVGLFAVFFVLANRTSLGVERLNTERIFSNPADKELVDTLNSYDNPGRLFISHSPFGHINWVISQNTSKQNVEGHYFAITRMNKRIAQISDAIHNRYYDFPINKMKYYNVRYFIGNHNLGLIKDFRGRFVGKEFMDRLSKVFKPVFRSSATSVEKVPNFTLYYSDQPSNYIMPVDAKIIVIGKYGSTLAQVLSSKTEIIEGGSIFLDDYSPEFLKKFDTVVLYGFSCHDKVKAEAIAKDYALSGGNLVVDLFNSGVSPLSETPSFLGVTGDPKKIIEAVDLKVQNENSPLAKFIPANFELPGEVVEVGDGSLMLSPLKEWNSIQYTSLDESLAKISKEDEAFSVLGYENVEGKKITYVGLNFFYHAYLSHSANELALLDAIVNKKTGTRNVSGARITQQEFKPNYLKFNIDGANAEIYIVSMAYSDHWRVYLDGTNVRTINLEDLIGVEIPAGGHTLEVKYQPTKIITFGNILSCIALALVIVAAVANRQKRNY